MPLESFVRVDSVIDGNFDDVSLVEFELVVKALAALKAGHEAEIPQVFFSMLASLTFVYALPS